jgi:hypothetical protein
MPVGSTQVACHVVAGEKENTSNSAGKDVGSGRNLSPR